MYVGALAPTFLIFHIYIIYMNIRKESGMSPIGAIALIVDV